MCPSRLSSRWFRSFGEVTEPMCALVCLPHAGGSASVFGNWHRHTSALRITAVQLPGREARLGEPAFTEVGTLVDAVAPALRPLTQRPYALYGHSMGALAAYELVRGLQARDMPLPVALFVSGRDAPQYGETEEIRHLPDKELLDRLRAWEGLDIPDLPQYAELLQLMLPTIRADLTLAETYRHTPGPPLPVPIRVLRGSRDPLVRGGDGGWGRRTSVDCDVREFIGGHFFVQDHERSVVAYIETAIGALLGREAWSR